MDGYPGSPLPECDDLLFHACWSVARCLACTRVGFGVLGRWPLEVFVGYCPHSGTVEKYL